MTVCGAEIRRNEHGRCGLLFDQTPSSKSAELSPFINGLLGMWEMWEWSDSNPRSSPRHFKQAAQYSSDSNNRNPFHMTRARRRVLRLPRAELSDAERRL